MHEWLSGGVSPCQGEGRGFESRLVLLQKEAEMLSFQCFRCFFFVANEPGGGHPAIFFMRTPECRASAEEEMP